MNLRLPYFPKTQEAIYDAELVRRFNRGDPTAFEEIVRRYRSRLYAIAYSFLHDRADAEEIAQDALMRAYRGLAHFRGDSSLATWLNRVTVNLARNRYWYGMRRHRQDCLSLDNHIGDGAEVMVPELASDVSDPAREAAGADFLELVSSCMQELDPNCREILTMRNVLCLPYDEISKTLDINEGTVKSRIARAREKLRALIKQKCPEMSSDDDPDHFFAQASHGEVSRRYGNCAGERLGVEWARGLS